MDPPARPRPSSTPTGVGLLSALAARVRLIIGVRHRRRPAVLVALAECFSILTTRSSSRSVHGHKASRQVSTVPNAERAQCRMLGHQADPGVATEAGWVSKERRCAA